MDTKTRPIYMLSTRDPHRLKMRGWKKILYANGKQKKVEQQYSYQTKYTPK